MLYHHMWGRETGATMLVYVKGKRRRFLGIIERANTKVSIVVVCSMLQSVAL